eukprot:scaffold150513_cov17-Tisochrysis_lutea.AAC.2
MMGSRSYPPRCCKWCKMGLGGGARGAPTRFVASGWATGPSVMPAWANASPRSCAKLEPCRLWWDASGLRLGRQAKTTDLKDEQRVFQAAVVVNCDSQSLGSLLVLAMAASF